VGNYTSVSVSLENEIRDALQELAADEAEETGLKVSSSSLIRKMIIDGLRKEGYLPQSFSVRRRKQDDKPKDNVTAIGAADKVGVSAGNKSGASKGAGKASLF
jgi:hypothetical protein